MLCEEGETAYIGGYLSHYSSPIASNASAIVTYSDSHQIDDGFIVALAGAETTYGKYGMTTWGQYNAWSVGNHKADNPYENWTQAITDVINLITTDSRYFPAGKKTTDAIYPTYQGPGYQDGLKNLNSIYSSNLGRGLIPRNRKEVDFSRRPESSRKS